MARKPDPKVDFLGIEPTQDKQARQTTPTVTIKMAEGLVGFVQLLLKNLPWTKDDTLDEIEQKLLVKDVVGFAKVNPWFARGIVWLYAQTSVAGLPIDVGAITATRLARHELIPPEIGMAASVAVVMSAAAHDIELPEDMQALASLFGGLSTESEIPPEAGENGTPDLVSVDMSA